MDEPDLLPATIEAIEKQSYPFFTLVVCVNQPDAWWIDPERQPVCQRNSETLAHLRSLTSVTTEIIDRSSPGMGWKGKKSGVGWARKTVMDRISDIARPEDIILSIDADTIFSADYLASVAGAFAAQPKAMGLSVPYYHRLPDDPVAARAILRYEIYMRYYVLNLQRISSPYAFTALGSAIACPVWAYRSVKGLTPKHSGEDFYFLQKLRKAGPVMQWIDEKVYPSARFSSRVNFGTGPAMIRGSSGDWSGYPLYPFTLFDEIGETCRLFPGMMKTTPDTHVVRFLMEKTREADPFQSLRTNFKELPLFVRACHEKLDGLRILQYLKYSHKDGSSTDEENFMEWTRAFYSPMNFSFTKSSIEELDQARDFLVKEEDRYRIEDPVA